MLYITWRARENSYAARKARLVRLYAAEHRELDRIYREYGLPPCPRDPERILNP